MGWWVLRISLLALLATAGFGQRQSGLGAGLPPVAPIPPLGPTLPVAPVGHRAVVPQRYYGVPFGFGGYDYGYSPVPNVIIVQPAPPSPVVLVQEPPREPIKSAISKYEGPAPQPVSEEQPTFAIVFKDGSTRSAVAVTLQDNLLHYVDPDGGHHRVTLDTVDRATTLRVNRERKLTLHLP